jgi:hypothetical protein
MTEGKQLDIAKSTIENTNEIRREELAEYEIDFATSNAISRVSIKILAFYIPIFWISGIPIALYWYGYLNNPDDWLFHILFFPILLITTYFIFILTSAVITKLFLILINLFHKPKQGIFKAEKGDKDFEFWCLRTELKKFILYLTRNCPLPWIDSWAFRWFGLKLDFSSHLNDAWVDVDFINFGRKVTVGQGAVVMSSMVVGKYLIIKEVIFDDYTVVGGVSTISPGTIIGKDTVIGALSSTNFKQILESGWIYFGIPGIKLKPNKYAESEREKIVIREVDKRRKFTINHRVNIDEDKKNLL